MKIDKKDLEKRQVELTIELSTAELQPYLDKASKKIAKEVNIPGFRKGNVPYDILKQNVGEATIYEEAFYEIVNKTLPQIVEEQKIDFVGQPKVDAEKIAPGNPLVYKAVLSLIPTVQLGDYKTLKAKKKKVETDEKKVEKTFEELKTMRAQEKLVDRAAKEKDKIEIDFTIKLAGVVIEGGQGKNQPLVIGEKKFIPGFEDNLIGTKKGDEKKFKVTFPKEYFEKKLAGRECDVEAKVNAVYEITLPKLDDDFAQSMNFKNWKELEKQIRENIKKELEQKEKERLELAILEEIIDMSTFDELPEDMIEIELKKMLHELEGNISQSGGKMEDYLKHIKKTEDDLKKEFKPQAEKRIKTGLIAKAVSEQEKIEASDKEVEAEIKKNLKAYEQMPEMKKQFESEEYKRYVRNMLVNRKTFEKLESFISE